ncbi:helix-turn-helix transcriptional regulator [Brevundimonas vesicularis]|uniref:helix-turn-helix transcriptional regulator n=1 Tax=Brevundimonas vesicularis TaxID=41276 RepID=UPI0038D37D7B
MFQEVLPGLPSEFGYDDFNHSDDLDIGDLSPLAFNLALTNWLEAEAKARMLISSDLMVRWMNRNARILVENGIIRVHDGRLSPRSPAVGNLLRSCGRDEYNCAISLDCQQRAWVVWAKRISAPPRSLVGIIFHPPRQVADFSALVTTQTLTPTEGRVVGMLLNGHETGRIAQALNISAQTLKTHIKHAYCKLEVKSRGDLFAQAAGFARP